MVKGWMAVPENGKGWLREWETWIRTALAWYTSTATIENMTKSKSNDFVSSMRSTAKMNCASAAYCYDFIYKTKIERIKCKSLVQLTQSIIWYTNRDKLGRIWKTRHFLILCLHEQISKHKNLYSVAITVITIWETETCSSTSPWTLVNRRLDLREKFTKL